MRRVFVKWALERCRSCFEVRVGHYCLLLLPSNSTRLGSGDLGGKGKGQSISHKNMQASYNGQEGWEKGAGGAGCWELGVRQGEVAGGKGPPACPPLGPH